MRILKSNPVLTIFNSYLVDSPQPSTISYMWNFGSLLGLCLVSQIVSGILLAMHYQGSAAFAFASVEHYGILGVFLSGYSFLISNSIIAEKELVVNINTFNIYVENKPRNIKKISQEEFHE